MPRWAKLQYRLESSLMWTFRDADGRDPNACGKALFGDEQTLATVKGRPHLRGRDYPGGMASGARANAPIEPARLTNPRRHPGAGANVRWGIREGWWFARRYLLYAIILMLIGGSVLIRRNPTTALAVLALYGLGISSIGAIVGALRPLCQTSLEAAIVGMVAMLPVTTLTVILAFPHSVGIGGLVGITLGFTIVYGGVGGLYLRSAYNR
jgi:hypothetical protein